MVLDQELKLTDDCITRLSEIKEYIDQELLSVSYDNSRTVLKESIQNMLLDIYQILYKDLW